MQTVRLPSPPRLDAQLAKESVNEEKRSVTVVFYSGATVDRYSWDSGRAKLRLDTSPSSIRLDSIKSGRAPVLDSHAKYSTDSVLGKIESAWTEGGEWLATLRFAKDDEKADRVWNLIQQGLLANVSMGVQLHKLREEETDGNKLYTAIDWEPYEISIVPLGADPNARILMSLDAGELREIEVAVVAAETTEVLMEKPNTGVVDNSAELTAARENAVALERKRVSDIRQRANPFEAQLGREFVDGLIDSGVTADDAGQQILTQLAKAQGEGNGPRGGRIEFGADARDKRRECFSRAIELKIDPAGIREADSEVRSAVGSSLLEMARQTLRDVGVRDADLWNKNTVARSALGVEQFAHSTGDFPLILGAVANKRLLGAYQYASPSYKRWAKASTAPDFKTVNALRLGEAPSLSLLPEGAQIRFGTIGEAREQFALATYAAGVTFMRQMLINDDLRAFAQLTQALGIQAARLENKTVYAILTANANMSDGVALFHANHGNLAGSGAAPSIATIGSAIAAMNVQKGIDGVTALNLEAKFLIAPSALRTTVLQQLVSTGIFPALQTNFNPYQGTLEPVIDAELDLSSTTAWYVAGDPNMGTVEYMFLEGEMGPRTGQQVDFDTEGIKFTIAEDFAAKAVDWRGVYKNAGA